MKITVQPSDPKSFMGKGRVTVVVDTHHDDVNLEDAMEAMKAAIVAYGFREESVEEYIMDWGSELSEIKDKRNEGV